MKKTEAQIQAGMQQTDVKSRKKYASPVIKKYGQVANLTKGGAPSAQSDAGMNNMRPA
jgi:hypothetical protein